jgi:hypothetical protein
MILMTMEFLITIGGVTVGILKQYIKIQGEKIRVPPLNRRHTKNLLLLLF